MNKFQLFLNESWHEITKEVTWPKFSELQSSATLVLVASIIFAIIVGVIDISIENGLSLLYKAF